MTTVLLCDDHLVFAEALSVVLEANGYVVVGIEPNGSELLAAVAELSPDLCILDLHLPGTDGLALLPLLQQQAPSIKVLVVSATEDDDVVSSIQKLGTVGFVHKARPVADIVAAVAAAAAGDRPFFSPVAPPAPVRAGKFGVPDLARFLTPRERDALERMVRGQPTAEIASDMAVSYATARTHIQNILTKLGVHSKLEAVAFAITHHIVPLPGPSSNRNGHGNGHGNGNNGRSRKDPTWPASGARGRAE